MYMFLWDWFSALMVYLGVWRRPAKLVFTGLDNTGKTTMLYMLNDGHVSRSNYSTQATVTIGDICFTIYELCAYQYWNRSRTAELNLYQLADGIVYFIDAADSERFEESRVELNKMLSDDKIPDNIPILILGNKIDRPNAVSEDDIKDAFHLHDKTTGKGNVPLSDLQQRRPLEIFMCTVVKRLGYAEGFQWLCQYIQ